MKTICLDYDGSYTEFPGLFEKIIDHCQDKGYEVIMVTMRYEGEATLALTKLSRAGIPVFYTGRKAKLPFLQDRGINPDLFIDDKPHWLFEDAV